MKTYSLEELTDEYIGKKGTEERKDFDNELQIDLLGEIIKEVREERNLTQLELGELVGVNKSYISKIENNTSAARFNTIIKVFEALGANVNFNIELKWQRLVY